MQFSCIRITPISGCVDALRREHAACGHVALVIATLAHKRQSRETTLGSGIGPSQRRLANTLHYPDASETLSRLLIEGTVDRGRFNEIVSQVFARLQSAVSSQDCRVAVFGELVALLWAQGKPREALRVEQFWNESPRNNLSHFSAPTQLRASPMRITWNPF